MRFKACEAAKKARTIDAKPRDLLRPFLSISILCAHSLRHCRFYLRRLLIPLAFSISSPCGKDRDPDKCHLVPCGHLGRDGTLLRTALSKRSVLPPYGGAFALVSHLTPNIVYIYPALLDPRAPTYLPISCQNGFSDQRINRVLRYVFFRRAELLAWPNHRSRATQ